MTKKKTENTTITITGTAFNNDVFYPARIGTFWLDLIAVVVVFLTVLVMAFMLATGNTIVVKFEKKTVVKQVKDLRGETAVLQALDYYRGIGYDNGYNKDIQHLRHIWKLCDKYAKTISSQYISSLEDKTRRKFETTDLAVFMFSVCADESNFDPTCTYSNTNGSHDSGITQINAINLAGIEKQLPGHLKHLPWTNAEKNIAGRYIWIKDRVKLGMPWDIMTKRRGWVLYNKIHKTIYVQEAAL